MSRLDIAFHEPIGLRLERSVRAAEGPEEAVSDNADESRVLRVEDSLRKRGGRRSQQES